MPNNEKQALKNFLLGVECQKKILSLVKIDQKIIVKKSM